MLSQNKTSQADKVRFSYKWRSQGQAYKEADDYRGECLQMGTLETYKEQEQTE